MVAFICYRLGFLRLAQCLSGRGIHVIARVVLAGGELGADWPTRDDVAAVRGLALFRQRLGPPHQLTQQNGQIWLSSPS